MTFINGYLITTNDSILAMKYFAACRGFLLLSAVVVVFAVIGCDSTSVDDTPQRTVEISTTARTYNRSASNDVYAHAALVNISDRLVYLKGASFDTVLDQRDGTEWSEIGAWYGVLGLPNPQPIEPGTFYVFDPLNVNELEPGDYRIRTKVYKDENFERLLPDEDLVSNVFTVSGERAN